MRIFLDLPVECTVRNLLLVISFVNQQLSATALSDSRDYCQGETFSASCADDEVIVIRSALYGRMRVGRCVPSDYGGHVGCRVTVLRQTDRMCSGRQSCLVSVSDSSFQNPRPCGRNLPSYLEVIYECLKVFTAPEANCPRDGGVIIRRPTGFISSHITERYSYGSAACPWRIELPRGERVNITLIDFSTPTADVSPGLTQGSFHVSRPCYQYAILTEKWSMTRNVRICGGDRREKNVYTSRTNFVEIRLVTKRNVETDQDFFFLLQIEAIGCSDPLPPKNGWVTRDGDGVYMGCNSTGRYWPIVCDGTKWVGKFENCTTAGEVYGRKVALWVGVTLSHTITLCIIVVLSVIAVVVIILISLVCVEWFKGGRTRDRLRSMPLPREPPPPVSSKDSQYRTSRRGHSAEYTQAAFLTTSGESLPRDNPSLAADTGVAVVHSSVASIPSVASLASDSTPNGTPPSSRVPAPNLQTSTADYVREMWPLAPPPGTAGGPIPFDREDNSTRDSGPALFQYGDSVTLMGPPSVEIVPPNPAPPPKQPVSILVNRQGGRRQRNGESRGDCNNRATTPLELDDDTHIYETPKYLRREKAATMRLKGKTQSQGYESGTLGGGEVRQRVSICTDPPYDHARYVRTMPRNATSTISDSRHS